MSTSNTESPTFESDAELVADAVKFLGENFGDDEESSPAPEGEAGDEEKKKKETANEPESESEEDEEEESEGEGDPEKEPDEASNGEKPKKVSTAKRYQRRIAALQEEKESMQQQLAKISQKEVEYEEKVLAKESEARFWREQVNKLLEKAEEADLDLNPVEAENEALKERLRRQQELKELHARRAREANEAKTRAYIQSFGNWVRESALAVSEEYGVDPNEVAAFAKMDYLRAGRDANAIDWRKIGSKLATVKNLQENRSTGEQVAANEAAPRTVRPGRATPQDFAPTTDGMMAFLRSQGLT